jgi:hypothetical protein
VRGATTIQVSNRIALQSAMHIQSVNEAQQKCYLSLVKMVVLVGPLDFYLLTILKYVALGRDCVTLGACLYAFMKRVSIYSSSVMLLS